MLAFTFSVVFAFGFSFIFSFRFTHVYVNFNVAFISILYEYRVSEKVLPACRAIHYGLQDDLGVDNYIGATVGKAYCGIVGSIMRHEFAVLGPSVNLSARLLTMPNHPGILISDDVRKEAVNWGKFLAFPPMKAKGYANLVPVFQPLTAKETRWGRANPIFVGRKGEVTYLCNVAEEMATMRKYTKMFFIWGESGIGKSDVLVRVISRIRKRFLTNKKHLILTRNVGNEGDSLIPFRYVPRFSSSAASS